MEQAVNTFQKGLLLDSNPMVQNNDSLSNALNATYITMNGNEVVLQNDMGNRRVDNAYLPSGYVPVGMKEHGGIIYVAAYNPLTNTSQVGSFPSPERNMGLEYDDLGYEFIKSSFEDYFTSNFILEKNLKFIRTNSYLFPITSDKSLHAGDKFNIYYNNDGITKLKISDVNFSNFNNTDIESGKIISPKNKCYTFSVGVLNSQNEFVDITKSLLRWNNGNIIDEKDKSELYKFNDGYFMCPVSYKNSITISDNQYLNNRLKLNLNTYTYKLVGPLYLKLILNLFLNLDYQIRGDQDDNNYRFRIITESIYNCPDGLTHKKDTSENDIPDGDDIFKYYDKTILKNSELDIIYDLYYLSSNNKYIKINPPMNNSLINIEFQSEYDSIENNYKLRVVKTYTVSKNTFNGTDDFNYYICTYVNNDFDKNYYLYNLSFKGTLKLSELGSGNVALKEWRFYNNWSENDNDTNVSPTIILNFESYPKLDQEFSQLYINISLTELDDNNKASVTWKKVSNLLGKTTFLFDWADFNIEPQKEYYVSFRCNDSLSEYYKYMLNETFYISTNLLDECYTYKEIDNFTKFWNTKYEYSNLSSNDKLICDKYFKVNTSWDFDYYISDPEKSKVDNPTILKNSSDDFILKINNEYNIKTFVNNAHVIYNEKRYPRNIIDTNTSTVPRTNITINPYIISLNQGDTIVNYKLYGSDNDLVTKFQNNFEDYTVNPEISYHSFLGSFSILLPELCVAKATNNFTLYNGFETIENVLEDEYKNMTVGAGFLEGYWKRGGGHRDTHKIFLVFPKIDHSHDNVNDPFAYSNDPDLSITCMMRDNSDHDLSGWTGLEPTNIIHVELDSSRTDSYAKFYIKDWQTYIDDNLNSKCNPKQHFAFCFISYPPNTDEGERQVFYNNYERKGLEAPSVNTSNINEANVVDLDYRITSNGNRTILFWKLYGSTWCIYSNLIEKKGTALETLKNVFPSDILNLKYAYYKELNSNSNLYKPSNNNYIYTEPYEVNLTINFDLSVTGGSPSYPINPNNDPLSLFESGTGQGAITKYKTINLKADSLRSVIDEYIIPNSIQNSDLNGNFYTYDGNPLNPDKFYYYDNEKGGLCEYSISGFLKLYTDGDKRYFYPTTYSSNKDETGRGDYLIRSLISGVDNKDHATVLNFGDGESDEIPRTLLY